MIPIYIATRRSKPKSLVPKKSLTQHLKLQKKSIVLLKNENEILPLRKKGVKIGLIGPLAADKSSPLGNWRIRAGQ